MAEDSHDRLAQRPRPVAELALEPLLELAPELARSWALALVRARPLEAIGEVPLQALADGGRSLCEQLLRALCSEAELDTLLESSPPGREGAPPHPRRVLEIAGADGPTGVVETIESLRGVVWETIAARLGASGDGKRSRATLSADLSDRLANVCAALSASAVAASMSGSAAPTNVITPGAAPPARSSERSPTRPVRADTGIVIVDERGAIARDPERPREEGRRAGRPVHEEPVPKAKQDALQTAPAEIAIRDARREEGPAAWIRSIGEQLERYERDGLPFAVILLEIEGDIGRDEQESYELVLAQELRDSGGGTLTRERAGRYWLLAHRADRIGAHALAVRLERALATAASAGAPAVAASGIAICPEDGLQPATLAAQADVGLYAARSEAGHAGAAGPGEPPV